MKSAKTTDFLNKHLSHDPDLLYVFMLIFESFKNISDNLDITKGHNDTQNKSGDVQLAMDVQADLIMQRTLCECNCVGMVASEEQDDVVELNGNKFTVVYDPLDGSSLVDANLSIGTIVGVFPGVGVIGRTGREMVGAAVAVYGPRTTVMISFGKGVHEFILKDEGFVLKNENIIVEDTGKYFAPGNLRATKNAKWYSKLVNYWMDNQYTLRYSGGMCPDVNHIFVKQKGIFCYPGYEHSPDGKLRLLYECNPFAYLMEQAGGKASDGNMDILDKPIEMLHQRTPIFIGSCNEVDLALKYLHDEV